MAAVRVDLTAGGSGYLRHLVRHVLLQTLSCAIICSYFNHTWSSLFADRQIVSVRRKNRETPGQSEGLRYLILTINPAKHEKHCDGETDRVVTVVEPLMRPLRPYYKLTIHDFLCIFSGTLCALVDWVGSNGAFVSCANAQNPGETTKIENSFHSWI